MGLFGASCKYPDTKKRSRQAPFGFMPEPDDYSPEAAFGALLFE